MLFKVKFVYKGGERMKFIEMFYYKSYCEYIYDVIGLYFFY